MSEIIHRLSVAEQDGIQDVLCTRLANPCGCTIEGGGTLQQPLRIKHCSTHAIATELRDMLLAFVEREEYAAPASSSPMRESARILLAKAGVPWPT